MEIWITKKILVIYYFNQDKNLCKTYKYLFRIIIIKQIQKNNKKLKALKSYNKNKKLCRMKTLKMIYNMKLLNNLVSRKQNKIIKFNN